MGTYFKIIIAGLLTMGCVVHYGQQGREGRKVPPPPPPKAYQQNGTERSAPPPPPPEPTSRPNHYKKSSRYSQPPPPPPPPPIYKRQVVINNNFYRSPNIYVKKPRIKKSYQRLPTGCVNYTWSGRNYYFQNGIYYDYYNNSYRPIAPPIGFTINYLPTGHSNFQFGGIPFFYLHGVFYRKINNYYVVEEPPIGAIIYDIPLDDVEIVTINDQIYYELNGCLYQENYSNYRRSYTVIGKYQN